MKSVFLTATAGSLALLAAAPGLAQMGPRGGGFGDGPGRGPGLGLRTLQAADADGDRTVSRAEFDGLAGEMFAWRDRNGDGALDQGDASPLAQRLLAQRQAAADDEDAPPRSPRGGRLDADDDGRVTQAEFMEGEGRLFARLDTDEDGAITPDELDEHADARRDRGRWWRER